MSSKWGVILAPSVIDRTLAENTWKFIPASTRVSSRSHVPNVLRHSLRKPLSPFTYERMVEKHRLNENENKSLIDYYFRILVILSVRLLPYLAL